MTLWIILTLMACAASVVIAVPLARRFDHGITANAQAVAFYEAQLKELEGDVELGAIDSTAARAAAAEIQRRMRTAQQVSVPANPISGRWRSLALASSTGFVAVMSVLLYGQFGSPELQAARIQVAAANEQSNPQAATVDDMIARLEHRLRSSPGDAEGWRMLGWSYFNTRNYRQSAEAYKKASDLDPANLDYQAAYAEALVQEAGGTVVSETAHIFAKVIAGDPANARARFYDALHDEQAGKREAALEKWMALLGDAPKDAAWLADVRSHIALLGSALNRDVSAFTFPDVRLVTPPMPDVDPETAASIQAMPAEGQQDMVKGMVERLAQKLADNPRDLEGWLRLMKSRTVLSDAEGGQAALRDALAAFSGDATAQGQIRNAAAQLGISLQ